MAGSTLYNPTSPHGTLDTRYVRMIVASDEVPWEVNVLASAANWILLAGYLVIPGTFTSMSNSSALQNTLQGSNAGEAVLKTVQNPPILVIGCLFFAIGSAISALLYWLHPTNYIWLINRLILYVFPFPSSINHLY